MLSSVYTLQNIISIYPLLCQLARLLVLQDTSCHAFPSHTHITHLGVPQQFQHSSLIRRESCYFSHDRPHKFSFRRCDSLAVARANSLRNRCRGVAFVQAIAKVSIPSQQCTLQTNDTLTASNHFSCSYLDGFCVRVVLHHVWTKAVELYSSVSHAIASFTGTTYDTVSIQTCADPAHSVL